MKVSNGANASKPRNKEAVPPFSKILLDPSTFALLFSNLLTIFFAVALNWPILAIMWTYLLQSIIIGYFNLLRILSLKEFSTEKFYINRRPFKPTEATKLSTAFFFAVHYGAFHLAYFAFLIIGPWTSPGLKPITPIDMLFILIAAAVFFANHFYSFKHNPDKGRRKKNIGTLMFFPYARIIPMHLMIGFAAATGQAALLPFLLLKTAADVIMHVIEHRAFK